ncbi:bomanin Tailed 2 [Drosophila tropicalis]|uniref:bomanin Tailed 2 n=1 Tax=Drosophila tropicalis TaxID=46794 RepID=UPI0035ABB1FA
MNSKEITLTLLLLLSVLTVSFAEPGKVYINGQCIDCNRPDNDDSIVIPPKVSGSMSCSSLTQGAVAFGLLYYIVSCLHI